MDVSRSIAAGDSCCGGESSWTMLLDRRSVVVAGDPPPPLLCLGWGKHAKDALINHNLLSEPEDRAVVGPSLRIAHPTRGPRR